MTTTTTQYQISLGDTAAAENPGDNYGTFDGDTPEAAVLACLREADHTRRYRTATQLSASPNFGRGSDDRSAWWYVTNAETGRFVGIYEATEIGACDHTGNDGSPRA